MNYVTKLGAYGLAGVAAFAVAVALMLSVSSTPTAEAALQDKDGAGHDGNAQNGDTVYVQNGVDTYVRFEIETAGSASASFTHGDASEDGQTLLCRDAADDATGNCDYDPDGTGVTVAVKIDSDSGKGVVFVKQTVVATNVTTSDEITVSVAQVPTRLTAKLSDESINSGQGTGQTAGDTTLEIRLLDENNKGIAGKTLTVVSSRALLSGAESTKTVGADSVTLTAFSTETAPGVLAGTVVSSVDPTSNDDDGAGYAEVTVTAGGSPGISTITVTFGELSTSVDLVLHGEVKTIAADAEQSTLEVDGRTFIVVTATDSAGNPVKDQNVSIKSPGGVTPPERLAQAVVPDINVNKDKDSDGTEDTGDIPACGVVTAVAAGDQSGDPPTPPLAFGANGTNDAGQCVIEVWATDNDTASPSDDAARGTHTITIVASDDGSDGPRGVNEATVEIAVGGAPATIESDAAERIDPSSEITVNVTVLDDEGVRVGGVDIEVDQTAGDGKIITDIASRTSDGRAKFTYLAPSTPGVAEFLVRTRGANNAVTAQLPIIVAIAEEAPPEPPAPPEPEASISGAVPSASGESGLVIIDNVDDTAELAALFSCDAPTVTLSSDSGLVRFVASAPDFVNAPFNASGVLPTSGPTPAFATCE